jgi:uncharacterized surface protein with fasciclin (FAS1) repeats
VQSYTAFFMLLSKQKRKSMKKQFSTKAAGVILALAVVVIATSCKDKKDDPPAPSNTLVDVATNAGLTSLTGALGTANLTNTLKGAGPFTVFAPTNAAFSAATVSAADLSTTLLYHVIDGKVLAAAVPTALTAIASKNTTTDSLYVLRVGSDVFINGTKVTTANAEASNGVAHIIGKVLIPAKGKNIVEVAIGAGFDSLAKAVTLASAGATGADNIAAILSNTNGLTVFAPTNAAFTALFAKASFPYKSIDAIPVAVLRNVLRHHVAGARVFSNSVANGSVPMVFGSTTVAGVGGAAITITGSGTVFNNGPATITATDVMAKNGVIHIINNVLIP